MQYQPRGGHRTTERGSAFAMTLAFSAIVGGLIVALISLSVLQSRSTRYELDRTAALSIAEGVTEIVKARTQQIAATGDNPLGVGVTELGGVTVPWTVTPLSADWILRLNEDDMEVQVRPYEVVAEVRLDSGVAQVRRVLELERTQLPQYMMFFDDDLEILPGPNMFLEGRVHANGSIYVGVGAANTLEVTSDYFRCTGEIHRNRKNTDSPTYGTVKILNSDSLVLREMTSEMDSEYAQWTQFALEQWGGTVQDGSHGIEAVTPPEIGSIEPDGHYHEEADLVIVDGQAFDGDGNPISLPAGVLTEAVFYDAREDAHVTVTEIDIAALNSSGFFPENGLLYAYRTDTLPSNPNGIVGETGTPHGIRLTNGEVLAGPLTVVTPAPLYIQGNYNTGGEDPENQQAAAVIADAVNLLSNAWDDDKEPGDLPAATNTDYNLLMVTGNVRTPDGGGAYSGGFENLPRFHEDWGGKRAKIRGSFACLYESRYANSNWSYGGDVYRAPIRDWRYDPQMLSHIDAYRGMLLPIVNVRRLLWDDGVNLSFQVAEGIASEAPIYDPWIYDPGFMDKVIEDPYAG